MIKQALLTALLFWVLLLTAHNCIASEYDYDPVLECKVEVMAQYCDDYTSENIVCEIDINDMLTECNNAQ